MMISKATFDYLTTQPEWYLQPDALVVKHVRRFSLREKSRK